jgi:dihydrofolate synthase/folylpolyglutamate synthase
LSTEAFWAEKAKSVETALLTRIPENKVRPRLEPTRRAVELLGDPQRAYRVIHVTGTNGKTSTTRFIERLLREHGLRTGRFTSPHLVNFNERMSIDGAPVSDEVLYEVWNDISPILEIVDNELIESGDTRLTFFEALAVLGFAVFADAPVDVLVLEVGMGGEWDSTNVADGDVAVFAKIGIDHADRLGSTIEEIAKTKSGIIKPGSIVVTSAQPAEALEVLKARAAAVAESIKIADEDFAVLDVDPQLAGQGLSIRGLAGEYLDLFLPLHGQYQAENLSLAIAAVEAFLGGAERKLMDDVVRVAVADASSPGRLQVVNRTPLTILDAAHNPDGAESLAQALVEYFGSPKAVGVLGVLAEKDAAGVLAKLADSFEKVVVTRSSSPRAIDPGELAEVAEGIFGKSNVSVAPNVKMALELAEQLRSTEGAIVVTGSISLVGDVLELIQKEEA